MKCRGYVWRSLIKIASTTLKSLAQNHTLGSTGRLITREAGSSPSTYSIFWGTGKHLCALKVAHKRSENDQSVSAASDVHDLV